eukprot:gnl/Spiro4/26169_TR13043_c0_g1_i1.p1 gnl/Spiro4/26169_TR13043_c0_g1~~gnl/Spiro4/26169_TR13043_c0_g1_i1.p1  ORF type:complete len:480 (-),score=88.63 gnl/Spiro4/26169_TR13043_c0_g1_i1:80-1519(-)
MHSVPANITNIACIGAGYVGGPTMATIAANCPHIRITVLDIAQERVDKWNSNDLPVYEPGLLELVSRVRGVNLFFSTDVATAIENAQLIFVCVNTPTKTFGIGEGAACDLSYIEGAGRTIAASVPSDPSLPPKIVVEKSTVPVRTAQSVQQILEAQSQHKFIILSNPEFLAEGTALADLQNPDRVLIGGPTDEPGTAAVRALADVYAHWVPREKILTTNIWSSELSKLVANAFLAQRISSINSISALCEASGADVSQVAKAIGSDSRIGSKFLQASLGFGGSCFQKDIANLVYLCHHFNLHEVADYWEQVIKINDFQKRRFATNVIRAQFNNVKGKRLVLLGFAFKKDTADTRESPAATVAIHLLHERAQIVVVDPRVPQEWVMSELRYQKCPDNLLLPSQQLLFYDQDPYTAAVNAHALLVCTEWDEFKTLDYQRLFNVMAKPAFIFDGRRLLNVDDMQRIGFQVFAIGSGSNRVNFI